MKTSAPARQRIRSFTQPSSTLKAPKSRRDRPGWVERLEGRVLPADTVELLKGTRKGRRYAPAVGLQIFEPGGKVLGVLPKPGNGPLVSAGVGGKNFDQLYVACGDKLYRRKIKSRGAPPAAK
jgi:hypothetical protein